MGGREKEKVTADTLVWEISIVPLQGLLFLTRAEQTRTTSREPSHHKETRAAKQKLGKESDKACKSGNGGTPHQGG